MRCSEVELEIASSSFRLTAAFLLSTSFEKSEPAYLTTSLVLLMLASMVAMRVATW